MPKMGIKRSGQKKQRRQSRKKVAQSSSSGVRSSGLAGALFSTTQQRVLSLLFGQSHRSFFATELINVTRSGSGAVQRELQRLESSGLVTVKRLGTQKHFQANPSSPIFSELRSIVIKTVGLTEPLRAALAPIESAMKLALLYGSIPKGTDTARSDVDLMIVSDSLTLEEIYAALAPTERQLSRRISPTLYTTEEFQRRRHIKDSFVSKVLMGEHIMLMGNESGIGAAR